MVINRPDRPFQGVRKAVIRTLLTGALSLPAAAAPPPEMMPASCVQTLCVLILPQAGSEVESYEGRLDARTGKQLISAITSLGVGVNVASSPVRGREESAREALKFNWAWVSDSLLVGSSCSLCSASDGWGGQAIGISIHGIDSRAIRAFIEGGGIRIWRLDLNGEWTGEWRELRLGSTHRVDLPRQIQASDL